MAKWTHKRIYGQPPRLEAQQRRHPLVAFINDLGAGLAKIGAWLPGEPNRPKPDFPTTARPDFSPPGQGRPAGEREARDAAEAMRVLVLESGVSMEDVRRTLDK